MASPVRIVLCGKHPSMATAFVQMMKPEYEVVHHCGTVVSASTELPAILRGEQVKPSSGIGSNAESETTQSFRAIVAGGGFTPAELDEIRRVDVLTDLVWLYPEAARNANAGPPPMDVIVTRAKNKLREIGIVEGGGEVKGGVYDF